MNEQQQLIPQPPPDPNNPPSPTVPTKSPNVTPTPQAPATNVSPATKIPEQPFIQPNPQPVQVETPSSEIPQPARPWIKVIVLLLVLALLLATAVVAWMFSNSQQPAPQPIPPAPTSASPSPSPVSSWPTVEGTSIRLQHPTDWKATSEESEYYGGQVFTLTNPSGSVAMILYPTIRNQFPYSFGNPETEVSSRTVLFRGAQRTLTETIVDNGSVYAEIIVPGEYSVLYGTGYPATTESMANLSEYQSSLEIITEILESVHDVTSRDQSVTKRYLNTEYGIGFAYPSQWVEAQENVSTSFDMKQLVSLRSRDFASELIPSFLSLSVWNNPQNLSLAAYERDVIAAEAGNLLYKSEAEPITVAGVEAYLDTKGCEPVVCQHIVIPRNGHFLELKIFSDVVDPATTTQILSSLSLSM